MHVGRLLADAGAPPPPKLAIPGLGWMDRMAARPAFQRAMKSTMPAGPPAM